MDERIFLLVLTNAVGTTESVRLISSMGKNKVALPGLEPGNTESKSGVLPITL